MMPRRPTWGRRWQNLFGRDKENRRDLVEFLESARLPVLFLGRDLRVQYVTPAAGEVLGLSDHDVGRPVHALRPRLPLDEVLDTVRHVLEHASAAQTNLHDVDGRRYDLRIQPHRSTRRRVDGVSVVFMHDSETQAVIDELRRSNRDLENFAAYASHELREPLHTTRLLLEMSCTPGIGAPSAEDDVARALESLDRMTALIHALLRSARLSNQRPEMRPMPLAYVVAEASRFVAAAIQESGARVHVEGPLPDVLGDDTLLCDLVSNLLLNAIQNSGGKPPRIHVGAEDRGTMVEVWCRDEGVGIEPDGQDEIFNLFHRRTRDGQGLGIGLALCRTITDLHGGRIWVQSRPHEGAEFRFTLPRARGETLSAPPGRSLRSEPTARVGVPDLDALMPTPRADRDGLRAGDEPV